jgi:hypothetical protein
MTKTIVYTCVVSKYDNIYRFNGRKFDGLDAEYVIYTDQQATVDGWQIRPISHMQKTPTRTSRWYKINSHVLFPEAFDTIWIDGNQIPYGSADCVISSAPLGTFKHPKRSCIYAEMHACYNYGKDRLEIMHAQMDKYRSEGYPDNNGLAETSCIYRTNNTDNIKFNNLWWKQIKMHSHRDQLSFDYTAWKLGIEYKIIPGCRVNSCFLEHVPHV